MVDYVGLGSFVVNLRNIMLQDSLLHSMLSLPESARGQLGKLERRYKMRMSKWLEIGTYQC